MVRFLDIQIGSVSLQRTFSDGVNKGQIYSSNLKLTNTWNGDVIFKVLNKKRYQSESNRVLCVQPRIAILKKNQTVELSVSIHGHEKDEFKIASAIPPYKELQDLKLYLKEDKDYWPFVSNVEEEEITFNTKDPTNPVMTKVFKAPFEHVSLSPLQGTFPKRSPQLQEVVPSPVTTMAPIAEDKISTSAQGRDSEKDEMLEAAMEIISERQTTIDELERRLNEVQQREGNPVKAAQSQGPLFPNDLRAFLGNNPIVGPCLHLFVLCLAVHIYMYLREHFM